MGKLVKLEVQQLHPTQLTVGMIEVDEKRKHFETLSDKELRAALKAIPVPTVLGRNGIHYAIDHHHLGRALWDAKIDTVFADVVLDLSKLTPEQFWLEMARRQYVHPYDHNGVLHGVAAIPDHVSGLIDDPFRSLASYVRHAGGYTKSETPFSEFQWADFFRTRIHQWVTPFQFKAAIDQGVHLARSPDAFVLPGYQGNLAPAPAARKVAPAKTAVKA
jgi:hypothetical protein